MILISSLFCVFFALADEYHQTFVTGRGGTWADVGIDCLGVFAAALATMDHDHADSATTTP